MKKKKGTDFLIWKSAPYTIEVPSGVEPLYTVLQTVT